MNATTPNDVIQALHDLSSHPAMPPAPPIGSVLSTDKMAQEVQDTFKTAQEKRVGISILTSITYKSISGNNKERDFLIRRIIQAKNDIYIDGVAMDIRMPRLVKVNQISRIHDVGTGRIYDNPYKFLHDKLGININNDIQPKQETSFTKVIERMHNEIAVLMYVVAIDGLREKAERNTVAKYVRSQTQDLIYTDIELDEYLISIAPDAASAGMALQRILLKDKQAIQSFVEALINVITSNGETNEKERVFLAKIMDLLENQGFQFNFAL